MTPSSHTNAHFFADVASLKQELTAEGRLVANRVTRAMHGLVEQDLDALEEVAIGDVEVNAANPILHEGVRRNLHGSGLTTGIDHLPEEVMYFQ